MLKVEWTDQALDKIEQISDYISLDSPVAAKNWIRTILGKEQLLIDNPRIGRIVPEYRVELIREIFEGNYRVIYKIEEKLIKIITVKNFRESRR